VGDFRYAARTLRRSPAFTATAIAVLTLGIGANTAIFSVVNTVLLQPLPYPQPDRLVQLMVESPYGNMNMTSLSRFAFWRDYTRAFEYMAAYDLGGPALKTTSESGSPEQFNSIHVSADYFPLFGAQLEIGRVFSTAEDRFAGPQLAVISHRLWRRKFGGDLNLAGKKMVLDDEPYRVIGVLRPGFKPEPSADIWLPLQVSVATLDHTSRVRVCGTSAARCHFRNGESPDAVY
jgi:putative ABC transport system permease protein